MSSLSSPPAAMSRYDPNAIIASANERLRSSNSGGGGGDLEEASLIFQSALLTWVDDARETNDPTIKDAVATLWLAYAQFLASAKQHRSSLEAYEQASNDPVAKHFGRVWLEYARYAMERNKPKTAQDVFVRALRTGRTARNIEDDDDEAPPNLDEQDRQLLWSEFLELTRMSTNNPNLTMEELQAALREQELSMTTSGASADEDLAVPDAASSMSSSSAAARGREPPSKKPRLDTHNPAVEAKEDSRTYVVTEDEVHSEAAALADILSNAALPDDVYGAWIAMDGNDAHLAPPPSLFQPSPPKLTDPSGKESLGIDAALLLILMLAEPGLGSLVLEVCKGLWTLQAVTEEASACAIERFDSDTKEQAAALQANLHMRISVSTSATLAAVQMMNDNEWRAFELSVQRQRQSLLAQTVWERRKLLCAQQTVLTKLGVPEFDGPTVDPYALDRQARVCAYLHSAFYLRSRVGEQSHRTMLASQTKRLEKELAAPAAAAAKTSTSPVPPSASSSARSPQHSPRLPPSLSPMNVAHPHMYSMPPAHLVQNLTAPQFAYNNQGQMPLPPLPQGHHPQPPMYPPPVNVNPAVPYYGAPPPPPPPRQGGYPFGGANNGPPPSQYPYGKHPP